MDTTAQRNFTRAILPWIVAAVMLVAYLITLEKVVTMQSVFPLARATGADWRASYTAPLTWLLTLPVRILPSGVQLLGLNFISAVCAALALALLARCVAILPHDRTQWQRDKQTDEHAFLNIPLAWVPALFAVLVCGLQLTFWEHALVGSGEAVDLLVFAFCVRCVLEYRIDEKASWLNKLAVVYGLGITNNFAMIAFFPALLVALIWIRGWRFFRFNFLARMFLLGLAGLSLYLLLPLVQMNSEVQPLTFWQCLKTNLAYQKQYLTLLPRWRAGWLGGIYALFPLLFAGIRWPASFGDSSPVGSAFTNAFAQILHAALLVFCLYLALDPPLGPREFGLGFALLPCYFLGALSVGYFSGFLLMVFSPGQGRSRRRPTLPPVVGYAVTAIVCAGALGMAGVLAVRNYPKIRAATGPELHDYATSLANSLPDQPALVLSDDPVRLHAVIAVLGGAAREKHMFVEAAGLATPGYHAFLRQRHGDRWPTLKLEPGFVDFTASQLAGLLAELGRKHELIYLHPSFGAYFETFHLEPRQYVYALKPYAAGAADAPVPGTALIAQQAEAWNKLAPGPFRRLTNSLAEVAAPRRRLSGAAFVGDRYSQALDWWGVELQRAGRFEDAAKYFDQALLLNPNNAAALINLEGNRLWRNGRQRMTSLSAAAQAKLQFHPGIEALMRSCGPVDLPEFAIEIARTFSRGGLHRQAAQLVRRALFYAPDDVNYLAALANVELEANAPDRVLAVVARLRPLLPPVANSFTLDIDRIEAFAYYEKTNFLEAERILRNTVSQHRDQDRGYYALSHLYVTHARKLREAGDAGADRYFTNALKVIEGQVALQPANPSAHFNYGTLFVFVSDYDRAAAAFSKVLELQKDNVDALFNRALSYLQAKRYKEAKRDYEDLLARTTTDFRVYFGLGEVAYHQQDWRAAREYYTEYLRYAPPNALEARTIRERLAEVKKK